MRGRSTSPRREIDVRRAALAHAQPFERTLDALKSRRIRLLGLALVVALGVAVQAWAALQWRANLDGDEAVFGLMARHALQGRLSAYMYGQHYQGTIEPLLGAGLIGLFGGDPFVMRLGSVLLFGIYLALHGALIYRTWGYRVALLSLLFLALPGRFILHWTYRPITNFGPMAICGAGMLLLAQLTIERGWRHYARLAAVGLLAGLAIWSQPLSAIYVAALGIVWFLGTPEWRAIYERVASFCERVVRISVRELLPLAALGVFFLALLVLFTDACEPAISYRRPRQVARLGLLALGAALPALALLASRRRRRLLGGAASVAAGFALGNAPQWGAWVLAGVAPSPTIFPACPTDSFVRLRMALREIYPLVWGAPFWPEIAALELAPRLLWLAALALALASLAAFAWANRITLWSLLGLAPIPRDAQPAAILGLLLLIPATLVLFGGNTVDWTSVRYLLIAWQAAAVIMALLLARIAARWRGLAALLALFWAIHVGFGNLGAAERAWGSIGAPYAREPVAAVERFLAERQARGGYADYWTVYTLSLVSEERLLLAPYNGTDRMPDTTRQVERLPIQAYLIKPGLIPPDRSTATDLVRALFDRERMGGTGPAFPRFRELLRGASVLERRAVGRWDVWIVRSSQ